ncbi:MAG: tetratricopeptide repeat protein [Candidatus Promineifilaceae bacterium]|nr:tetratricopeptide repeat protein [Candidatus Promineifilaceae bacterium]
MADPACRLLTILGAGGMGKTRLSIAAAHTLVPDFTDGVTFVSLAAAGTHTAVDGVNPLVGTLADALSMSFYGESAPEAQIINYLRRKELLLVLDNFEHLLSTADFISHLLQNTPDIKIIVTSQERLNLQEEWLFPLQGLQFPKGHPGTNSQSYSAIALFLQRAKQVNRSFDPEAEREAILRICRLLAGMPLGIELAAGWVSQLSCQEIVTEIERELDFLSSDVRNIPARHRSMRAVFAYSWQRLEEDNQQVLQRLSVFSGGFEREAADAIADTSIKKLAALVDKSIIRRNRNGRYEIHELMRQFAAEKLGQHPELKRETQHKHGRFYLEFIAAQEIKLHGENGRLVIPETRSDIDNIRAAWHWGVRQWQITYLNHAIMPFFITFFDSQGWYLEGKELAEQAYLALDPVNKAGQDPVSAMAERDIFILRVQLRVMTGYFQWRLGRFEQGIAILEETASEIIPSNDQEKLIWAFIHFLFANAVHYRGEFTRTRAICEGIVPIFQAQNGKAGASICLYLAGLAAEAAGEYEDAVQLGEQSLQLAQEAGSEYMTFYGYRLLGKIAIARGNYKKAEQDLKKSFDISWSYGFSAQSMLHLNELGDAARLQGKLEEANRYYKRSLKISLEANSATAMASTYRGLGNLAWQAGEYDAARAYFAKSKQTSPMKNWTSGGPGWVSLAVGDAEEARQIFMRELQTILSLRHAPRALDVLTGLAHVQAQTGQRESARELIALILQHHASTHESKARAQQLRAKLMVELSPTTAESGSQELDLWTTVALFLDAS